MYAAAPGLAAKRMRPHLVLGEPGGRRFPAALRSLAVPPHPNLAGIVGLSEGPGERVLIVERASAGSVGLDALLYHGGTDAPLLPWPERAAVAAGAARGWCTCTRTAWRTAASGHATCSSTRPPRRWPLRRQGQRLRAVHLPPQRRRRRRRPRPPGRPRGERRLHVRRGAPPPPHRPAMGRRPAGALGAPLIRAGPPALAEVLDERAGKPADKAESACSRGRPGWRWRAWRTTGAAGRGWRRCPPSSTTWRRRTGAAAGRRNTTWTAARSGSVGAFSRRAGARTDRRRCSGFPCENSDD